MKTGDIWNWALATMAIMMLFLATNCIALNVTGSDKYRGVFVIIVFSGWAAIINFVILGLLSLIKKSSQPIIGSLLGVWLFGAIIIAFMIFFVALVFLMAAIAPDQKAGAWFRMFTATLFIGMPICALVYSIVRQPKQKTFQQPPTPCGSPAAGSPTGKA